MTKHSHIPQIWFGWLSNFLSNFHNCYPLLKYELRQMQCLFIAPHTDRQSHRRNHGGWWKLTVRAIKIEDFCFVLSTASGLLNLKKTKIPLTHIWGRPPIVEDKVRVCLFLPLRGDICRKAGAEKYQLTVRIANPGHVTIMQICWIFKRTPGAAIYTFVLTKYDWVLFGNS